MYVLNHDNKTSALFLPLMTILRLILILILYLKWPKIESIFIAIVISIAIKFFYVSFYAFELIKKNEGTRLIDRHILQEQL